MADARKSLTDPRGLLTFGQPSIGERPSPGPQRRPQPRGPGGARQEERLGPRFRALTDALKARRAAMVEQSSAPDPELVAVMDVRKEVTNFGCAVRHIDGLDHLLDVDLGYVDADDEFHIPKGDGYAQKMRASVYIVMTNAEALGQLISLFGQWQTNERVTLPRGLNPLKQLFALLDDIRQWGPQDRVRETGLLEAWKGELAGTEHLVRAEVELWFRDTPEKRDAAEASVRSIVGEVGGQVVSRFLHAGAGCHGLLVDLPRGQAQRAVEDGAGAISLLTANPIMFVAPSRAMEVAPHTLAEGIDFGADRPLPTGAPRVALLDGLPVANHALLAERVVVDDPGGVATVYPVDRRLHGTGLASLIIHGDLLEEGEPSDRPLYVRPILVPEPDTSREVIPRDRLLTDVIHAAVRRIVEGDGEQTPVAPSVRAINLSVGDPARVFIRHVSPAARIVDWLAATYNLVFLISAGNQPSGLTIDAADRSPEAIRRGLYEQARARGVFSPAESINAVTVGALHSDRVSIALPSTVMDPLPDGHPAVYTPCGTGFRRSVKPDALLPGGRQLYSDPPQTTGRALLRGRELPGKGPGLCVAAPGTSGEATRTAFAFGTSHATALATRGVDRILGVLEALRSGADAVDPQYHPVLAKALLIHATDWGDLADELADVLQLFGTERRKELIRLLGYGPVRQDRLATAESHRAVLIGAGSIKHNGRHTFALPLPGGLSGRAEWRRLTITLAWFSPVNPRSQRYRVARLEMNTDLDQLDLSRQQGDSNTVKRGTVQHEVFESEHAVVLSRDEELQIHVECRQDGGSLDGAVRYGLAVSLEVGPSLLTDIHTEIQQRLALKARARVGGN